MPAPFYRIEPEKFSAMVTKWASSGHRRADSVHMHHTWRPRKVDWSGESTVIGMWKYHTQKAGYSDIAQHVTIGPDGSIWSGRHWDLPPASAVGRNGNSHVGPFMFEMVGDFDLGRETLGGAQLDTVLAVIATVQDAFGLGVESLKFHRNLGSKKTCPGTSVDYAEIVNAVRKRRADAVRSRGVTSPSPEPLAPELDDWLQATPEPLTEEQLVSGCACDCEPAPTEADLSRGGARVGGARLDAAALTRLRPHVVDLWGEALSGGGRYQTTEADIDAIFARHLPQRLDALPKGARLPIVLYAHGGLVDEETGLATAAAQVPWWNAIGCYPIQFVWETGLWEQFTRLLGRDRDLARDSARGLTDVGDRAAEAVVRGLAGPRIWRGMKEAARDAFEKQAAGTQVLDRLVRFAKDNPERISLHAVGHSAGAIFMARLIDRLAASKGLRIDSLSLLAPAITVADYLELVEPRLPAVLRKLRIFTMTDQAERADTVTALYHKSLLYLINKALEPRRDTPILGLQKDIMAEPVLVKRLGLDGTTSTTGEVIWSPSHGTTGISLSQARTHGGFDNDPATMESVACGILGLAAATDLPRRFPPEASQRGLASTAPLPEPERLTPGAAGTRKALCIGINAYPGANALAGCVPDARAWGEALTNLGFSVTLMLDEAATQARILSELELLVGTARKGDVLAVHYSGHGTYVEDLDGNEEGGQDQAICPIDFEDGRLIIDDDLDAILGRLPDGVSMTLFMDNCHAFSNTRAALTSGERARALVLSPNTIELYRLERSAMRARGLASGRSAGLAPMRWVAFAASQRHEAALEHDGHGDFSRIALSLLAQGGSNAEFLAAVMDGFGEGRRQTPGLDCGAGQEALPLLGLDRIRSGGALVAVADTMQTLSVDRVGAGSGGRGDDAALADLFDALSRLLRGAAA